MTNPTKSWPDWDGLEAQCPWWGYILLGVLALPFAGFFHQHLTDFENRGGTMKVHVVLAWLYQTLGKWGIVGFFVFPGILGISIGFWLGIRKLMKSAEPE